jgi:hypothetical protein
LDAASPVDAALLHSLVITAESLPGPANGSSLALKPSGTLVFKHLIARFAIYETNNAGDKRALQWHVLAGWRSCIKNAAGSKYMAGGVLNWAPAIPQRKVGRGWAD